MTIEASVRQYITEKLLVGRARPFSDSDSFLQSGIVDSLGILDLVTFVEERFGVAVEDDEVVPDNFDSVDGLARYIRAKR